MNLLRNVWRNLYGNSEATFKRVSYGFSSRISKASAEKNLVGILKFHHGIHWKISERFADRSYEQISHENHGMLSGEALVENCQKMSSKFLKNR